MMVACARSMGWIAVAAVACAACGESAQGARPPGMDALPAAGAGTQVPGTFGAGSMEDPSGAPGADASGLLGLGANGITRLSRQEYRDTLRALLGVDVGSDVELLPADSFSPFDNDYTLQVPSKALVEGLRAVADRAVDRALADPALRAALLPCSPTGPDDVACLRDFIVRFGRRALRRPLADAEVAQYLAFSSFAVASQSFDTAVGMVARAMLQDLEFVYRVEIGAPIAGQPGAFRLGAFETASRLSFLLWGEGPDDALLDRAAGGGLGSSADVRAAAERLLSDPRGVRRIERFHALWLGYDTLPHEPELNGALRKETDALVRRVVFEDRRPWLDLFRFDETWANAELAELYGLSSAPADGFAWVPYATPERRGLLAHGSLLSNGVSGGDTSPTRRGKFVRERLSCTPVPPPPPDVNADEPPADTAGANCKVDRYAAHRSVARCAGCHALMDGVGFGLENYDARGAYREHDEGKPECAIDGQGELAGVGTFRGPAELGALLASSGALTGCLAQRLYQFGVGREPRAQDAAYVDALSSHGGPRLELRALVLDWVASDGFRTRLVDEL